MGESEHQSTSVGIVGRDGQLSSPGRNRYKAGTIEKSRLAGGPAQCRAFRFSGDHWISAIGEDVGAIRARLADADMERQIDRGTEPMHEAIVNAREGSEE